MKQILVLSGHRTATTLPERLRRCGFETALHGLKELRSDRLDFVDLVVVEMQNDEPACIATLSDIRRASNVPIFVVSDIESVTNCVVALERGADDYVSATVSELELIARIKALLRRSTMSSVEPTPDQLVAEDLTLYVHSRRLVRSEENVDLTPHEFDLLRLLLGTAGRLVSRRDIAKDVFRTKLSRNRSIDVHMSSLRRKLGPRPDGSERIRTIRGHGYIYLVEPNSSSPLMKQNCNREATEKAN